MPYTLRKCHALFAPRRSRSSECLGHAVLARRAALATISRAPRVDVEMLDEPILLGFAPRHAPGAP